MRNWMVTYLRAELNNSLGVGGPDEQNADHLYGWGLALWIREEGPDAEALAQLNLIRGDLAANTNIFANEVPGVDTVMQQPNARRRWARWLRFAIELTELDGQAANVTFRNKIIDLMLQDPSWDDTWGQWWIGQTITDDRLGAGSYAAGSRITNLFQIGLVADSMWHALRVLYAEDDLRYNLMGQRLIAMADFWMGLSSDAGDRLHQLDTGRNITNGSVIRSGGGGSGRGNGNVTSVEGIYRISPVNNLVFAYKLTGNQTYLIEAWNLWKDWQKITAGGVSNKIDHFADMFAPSASSPQWGNNKGELQYVYALFDGGGNPRLVNVLLPSWYTSANDKTWINMTSTTGSYEWDNPVWNPETGSAILAANRITLGSGQDDHIGAIEKWCGAIARENFYVLALGGGHLGGSGNVVYEFGPFASETPNWHHFGLDPTKYQRPSDSGPNGNITNWDTEKYSGGNTDGYYSDGLPASRHTYARGIFIPSQNGIDGGQGFWANASGLFSDSSGTGTREAASVTFRDTHDVGCDYDPQDTWDDSDEVSRFGGGDYDPVTGAVYVAIHGANGFFYKYNITTKTRTTLATPSAGGTMSLGALDPNRRIFVSLKPAENRIWVFDLDHDGRVGGTEGNFFEHTNVSTGGYTNGQTSMIFEPVGKSFILYAGGSTVYKMAVPANYRTGGATGPLNSSASWVITAITNGAGGGTPSVDAEEGGLQSRMRYISSIKALACQINADNGTDQAMWVYKIPAEGL
jgi:hypothetical protein